MLIEKPTEDELLFMESWFTPLCLTESLFSNFDNQSEFAENRFGHVRLYQETMLSYDNFIDTDTLDIGEKEKFELKKGAAECYNFGSRRHGKSLVTEKLDIPLSMLYDDNYPCIFSSADAIHLRGILDIVKIAMENHPILKMWKGTIRTAPSYRIESRNGWLLEGVNMNIASRNPGNQFFSKHCKKMWIEEASLETPAVYNTRKDSISEVGTINRHSGMSNFTEFMPAGKAFYEPLNHNKIINLPQMVNPFWNEKEKQERLREYGGVDAPSFRIFVLGEVVKSGVSVFDMDRVKVNYNYKKEIKAFEINRKNLSKFQETIVVERPKNSERIFVCSDIGESAGSEIVIASEVKNIFYYLYRIALYDLTDKEQFEIFKWLVAQLQANVLGFDCSEGTGRAIYRRAEEIYPKDNLVWYAGGKKINVDFERDENNRVIIKNGQPVYKKEYMSEWSVRRLKVLLYEERLKLPLDHKFNAQIGAVVSMQSGTRTVYNCIAQSGDHLFDAFKVLATAEWLKNSFNDTPSMSANWGSGVSSWS